MKKLSGIALAWLMAGAAYADVGPDYVCQDTIETNRPAPQGAIDYWTNVVTAYDNPYSGEVEVFLRGPGLVDKRVLLADGKTDQRWITPVNEDYPAQGVFLSFSPSECLATESGFRYCARNRDEASTPILAAGKDEKGKKQQHRELKVQAKSVQAVLSPEQYLISLVQQNGERLTLAGRCDNQDWYPHIRKDELNRSDLPR